MCKRQFKNSARGIKRYHEVNLEISKNKYSYLFIQRNRPFASRLVNYEPIQNSTHYKTALSLISLHRYQMFN